MSKNVLEFIAEGSMKDNLIGFLRKTFGKRKPSSDKKEEKPFKWEHLNPEKTKQKAITNARVSYILGASHDSYLSGKAAGAEEAKKNFTREKRKKILNNVVKRQKSKMARARTKSKKIESPVERAELTAKAKPASWHTKLEKEKAHKLKRILKTKDSVTSSALKAAQVLTARADKKNK